MVTKELNDTLDALKKVKELLSTPDSHSRDTSERESMLTLILEELRIIYDRLDSAMVIARNRMLTFLGASLALLSYVYSGGIELPDENYGKVFSLLGLALVTAAVGSLVYAIRPSPWAVPIETKLNKLHKSRSKLELLEIIAEEYTESMATNIVRYEYKAMCLNTGFTLLFCGGILLLIIKIIGG